MRRGLLTLILLGVTGIATLAQEIKKQPAGKLDGEWRTFYLHTFNHKDLRDFYSIATGGHIGYTYTFSPRWKAGARLYTTFNTNIQDLTIPDETTGRLSRYEIGMYDMTDPENRFFVLPGELFLTYTGGKHSISAGRMKKITPFINPQDGRMIPTLVEGLWYSYDSGSLVKVDAGLITRIASRGTDRFSRIGQSIGKFSGGRNTDGKPAGYPGNTKSDFIFVTGVKAPLHPSLNVSIWNFYVDNVFNTTYIRPEWTTPQKTFGASVEWVHQRRVADGGNAVDSLRYFEDSYANLFGAMVFIKADKYRLSLAYDHITDDGRFLFPREWGREMIFTFQKRERSEGTRKNHALVLSIQRRFEGEESSLDATLSAGHQWKPDPTDVLRNKYALPGYTHINLDLVGKTGKIRGLVPELLLTWKVGRNDFPENPNFLLNKVDMFQVNFVLNYRF